jgi:hypothetical protein
MPRSTISVNAAVSLLSIAGGKDDRNARLHRLDRFKDFRSAATRHDHVQQDKRDRVVVGQKIPTASSPSLAIRIW